MKNFFRISFLLMAYISLLDNINVSELHAMQSLYRIDKSESNFYDNYTLLNVIGKGTNSTIFLSKNTQGDVFAVKKYEVAGEEIIDFLNQNGIRADTFITQLAQNELQMGQLTDHSNIVKIKEVFFENCTAYVVMDHIEGQPFDSNHKYTSETRVAFMQQFLSAIEHLLLRNIIATDLSLRNIQVSSKGSRLILMDLGKNEMIMHNSKMSVGDYVEMIEHNLQSLGGESAEVLDSIKHFPLKSLTEETLSPVHVRGLISWIEALQKELATPFNLNNTLCEDSANKVLAAHTQLQPQYPDHISFNTAQHSKFLAYSIIAANVLQKFNPGKYPGSYLQNTHTLRYPHEHLPKSLKDLFRLQPVREDYDTASSLVAEALISVSPSLKERESDESAWAIFKNNERKGDVADYICNFFESEKVSPVHFRSQIREIVKETPKSHEGLIYNFFIPKNAPLHKAIYLSEPYGIPIGDPLLRNNILSFYEKYEQGLVQEENSQLRFLPSALNPENNFDLTKIKSFRFTTIPQEQLTAYIKKIGRVVNKIYQDHLEEMLQLTALASEVERLPNFNERQKGYQKLCYRHLYRRDIQLALYYWHKMDDQSSLKVNYLPGIISCLLNQNQLIQAEHYFQQYEPTILHKEQIVARFALIYIERNDRSMLDSMLKKLSESNLKNYILILAGSFYPEYRQECVSEAFEIPMSDGELINLAQPLD